jgi:asparagine synthase (glutamine-hydrolysing)
MCGIAGCYGQVNPGIIREMLDKMAHRGPDESGLFSLLHTTLGHARLSILDVKEGRQPIYTANSGITFNGEIYNHLDLRSRYLADESFRTRTDTEVIVRLYDLLETDMVSMLDGMFAFVIQAGNEILAARDPLGIKPLYMGKKGGMLYFASEIKALALATDDIHLFPAGYYYHSKTGWHCFYDLRKEYPRFDGTEVEAIEQIRTTLRQAVVKRLMADVPVGVSLSGGLDSSIVALLAQHEMGNLHSFAVGMQKGRDLPAARKMATLLKTNHHEYVYTEKEMLEVLPQVIYHLESFDPALVRSAIPNYFLARLTADHVKVFLTGEGADELFAGYDYLGEYDNPALLQKELINITAALQNTNLQRADRISMAFGLEARVPFLDTAVLELAFSLPPEWKLHRNGNVPKRLLRAAFANDLPEEIVNRPKEKFSAGAGSSDVLGRLANETISDEEFLSERGRLLFEWNYRLPNKEALYYYRILHQSYQDQWIFPTMGHSRSL